MAKQGLDFRNPLIRSFRDNLDAAVNEMRKEGLERETLLMLAEKLQERLACDNLPRKILYSQPLEVLMRVVAALLDGMPHTEAYVRGKFRVGMEWLVSELRS